MKESGDENKHHISQAPGVSAHAHALPSADWLTGSGCAHQSSHHMLLLQVQGKVGPNSCLPAGRRLIKGGGGAVSLYTHFPVSLECTPNAYQWEIERRLKVPRNARSRAGATRMACTEPFPRRAHLSPERGSHWPELPQQVNSRAQSTVLKESRAERPGKRKREAKASAAPFQLPLCKRE